MLSLRLKLNTKITFNHPPPPTTNFLKGSRPSRSLRFDMQAYLRIYRINSNISLPTQALKLYPSLTKTSSYSSKSYFKVKSLLKLNTFDLVLLGFRLVGLDYLGWVSFINFGHIISLLRPALLLSGTCIFTSRNYIISSFTCIIASKTIDILRLRSEIV